MNMAVGITLVVSYFPMQVLDEYKARGLKVFYSYLTGQFEDGTVFRAVHPREINAEQLAGLSLRKVILKRNIALTAEQLELLRLRRRVIIRGDFISVE